METTELLITYGANINEKNYYGETTLLIAACNNISQFKFRKLKIH